MGISERKQRHKDQVRESILSTAWQLVLDKGWQALSIRNIAEAIEYSAPVIYSHFINKEAILFEFYKEGCRLMAKYIEEAVAKGNSPENQLYLLALAYWNFAFENKEYYQLMFGVDLECYKCKDDLEEFLHLKELFKTAIEKVVVSNGSKDLDILLKRSTLWSILHGLVSINLTGKILKEEGRTERVLDDAIKSFILSLK